VARRPSTRGEKNAGHRPHVPSPADNRWYPVQRDLQKSLVSAPSLQAKYARRRLAVSLEVLVRV